MRGEIRLNQTVQIPRWTILIIIQQALQCANQPTNQPTETNKPRNQKKTPKPQIHQQFLYYFYSLYLSIYLLLLNTYYHSARDIMIGVMGTEADCLWILFFRYPCFSTYLSPFSPLTISLSFRPKEALSEGLLAKFSK